MDRSKWLTMLYREANLFLERTSRARGPLAVTDIDDLEPELHEQIQEVLSNCEELEDLIKYSLLKNPPAELWQQAASWEQVVIGVASACAVYDVKGIAKKILAGDLPAMASSNIHDEVDSGGT